MTDEPRTPEPDDTAPTQPLSEGDPLGGDAGEGPSDPKDASPSSPPGVRRLTRSSSDKLIGGVAGGLGRYFGVDPILFRIAFVALAFAGGVGILAYIGLLAFVPADDDSRLFGERRAANLIGAIVLGLLVLVFLGPPFFFVGPALIPIAILIGVGVLLWRASGGSSPTGGDPVRLVARATIALLIGIAAVGGFAGVFVLAALGGGTILAILAIVAGVALVVAGLSGGARWLIAPALVLVLPLAIVAAADVRVEGGVGERQYRPASAGELRPAYQLGAGQLVLDMRDVDLPAGTTAVELEVGIGHTVVRVPEDACVSSDVQLGVGHARVLDRISDGLDVDFEQASAATGERPVLRLDTRTGIGALEVVRGDDPVPSQQDAWPDSDIDLGAACP